jgi:hypothetical protein
MIRKIVRIVLILSYLVGLNIQLAGVLCCWGKQDLAWAQKLLVMYVIIIRIVLMLGNYIYIYIYILDLKVFMALLPYVFFFCGLCICLQSVFLVVSMTGDAMRFINYLRIS